MAIDMFDTRTMIRLMEQMKPARTFLKDSFFPTAVTSDTEYVDIDIIKGARRMAPFVNPVIGGKTVERRGYSTETYKPPLVAPDMVTTAEDLMKRAPGEHVYSPQSPDERAAARLGRDIAELDDMITRREEWMCAQALFAGVVHVTGEGVDEMVDFGLTHEETLLEAAKWTTAETSNPIADFVRWRRAIIQDSGVSPTDAILGAEAVDALMAHEEVRKLMDLRRLEIGVIKPEVMPNGVTYLGYLSRVALDLWAYDEWYLDDSGVEQPMVPVDKVLVGSRGARTSMMYGAVADVNRGTFALPRVPKSWTQEKPSARFVQISSRPLPVPHQVDAFFVSKVK